MKLNKGKPLVEQKIYFYCIISASCLFICPAHPFSLKWCAVKNVDYKDVPPWRMNPRNIIDCFFHCFLWGMDLSVRKHIGCLVYSKAAKGVDTLLPASIGKCKSVMRVSLSSSNQNIVVNSN